MIGSKQLKKYARIGIASKGIVYILAGGLTCLAALNLSNQGSSGKETALSFIDKQPFGKILLILVALGLLGYTVFRLIVAYNYQKSDKSAAYIWGKKIAYAASGLFYLSIAFTALKKALSSSSGDGDSKQTMIGQLLSSTLGEVVLFVVLLIIVGRALFQFYQAWSGNFSNRIKDYNLNGRIKKTINFTGIFGYSSRGVVILIISYMFFKAIITQSPDKAKGMEGSFQLLQGSYGSLVLAVIAAGLFFYGVFMLIKSYYSYMPELE